MSKTRRLPMFAIAGKVTMKVMKVPLKALFLLKKKKSLAILKDLIMVV